MMAKGKGKGKGKAIRGSNPPGDFKSHLNNTHQKATKKSIEKGAMVYEVTEVEGGFQGTLELDDCTYVGEVVKNKKDAEHQA